MYTTKFDSYIKKRQRKNWMLATVMTIGIIVNVMLFVNNLDSDKRRNYAVKLEPYSAS